MILKSNCPHCSNPIEYDSDDAGLSVHCPHCNKVVFLSAKAGGQVKRKTSRPGVTVGNIVGVLLCLMGMASCVVAKNGINESTGAILFVGGVIVMTMAFVADCVQDVVDRL